MPSKSQIGWTCPEKPPNSCTRTTKTNFGYQGSQSLGSHRERWISGFDETYSKALAEQRSSQKGKVISLQAGGGVYYALSGLLKGCAESIEEGRSVMISYLIDQLVEHFLHSFITLGRDFLEQSSF